MSEKVAVIFLIGVRHVSDTILGISVKQRGVFYGEGGG
jgi:hypothetical protein